MRYNFRLRLGSGVALRLQFAKRFSPLSAPLSPLADHRPKLKSELNVGSKLACFCHKN
jgi:hypothetical protein